GGVATAPDVRVKRVPIDSAEFPKRRPESGRLALARQQYHGPPSRAKSVSDVSERAFVRPHWSPDASAVYHEQPELETKCPISHKDTRPRQLFLETDFRQRFQNQGPRRACLPNSIAFPVLPRQHLAILKARLVGQLQRTEKDHQGPSQPHHEKLQARSLA